MRYQKQAGDLRGFVNAYRWRAFPQHCTKCVFLFAVTVGCATGQNLMAKTTPHISDIIISQPLGVEHSSCSTNRLKSVGKIELNSLELGLFTEPESGSVYKPTVSQCAALGHLGERKAHSNSYAATGEALIC